MRQMVGEREVLLAAQVGDNAAPSLPGDGIAMSVFTGALKPCKYIITVTVTGATANVSLYGMSYIGDQWGFVGENDGLLNSGAVLAVGTYHFRAVDLGVFERLYARVTNGAGATVSAWITEVLENNNQRGD